MRESVGLRIRLNTVRPDLAEHLEKSVESIPHVQSAQIEFASACVKIEHDHADRKEIAAVLRDEGFEVRG